MNKIDEAINDGLQVIDEKVGFNAHYQRHPRLYRAAGAIAGLGLATGLALVITGDMTIGGSQGPETAQQRAYDPVAIHRSVEYIRIGDDILGVDALATGTTGLGFYLAKRRQHPEEVQPD